MPTTIIAANWKMNTTLNEAKTLVCSMKERLEDVKTIEKVICPPFVSLATIADIIRGSGIYQGAQNMHFEEQGAYTGEISARMLTDICQYVILGHSERRQSFRETDDLINNKVEAALKVGLKPIVCVGESLEAREAGRAEEVVETQIKGSLGDISYSKDLVLAYEPLWAIGTGRSATPDVAQSMMAHVRAVLSSLYQAERASRVPLLYGGSVNHENISAYIRERDINGALVGGASLNANSFVRIVQIAAVS